MEDYGLDLHGQILLDQYRELLPTLKVIEEIVRAQLQKCIDDNNLYIDSIESRIKTEKSFAGKLERKGSKYATITDITDLMGARVITLYSDDVDKVAALLENVFIVDYENSVDKRKAHEINSFGYMSLHYVCRIPKNIYFDPERPEINTTPFEIQMRTALQHVWAVLNHDTEYKSGLVVPPEQLRQINRLAGLLELADEQFSRIRREVNEYRRQVQSLVESGNFDEVPLNNDTYRSYLNIKPFDSLVERIAAINQAEIIKESLIPYLELLLKLGFKTIGDIERLKNECSEKAYRLAAHQIGGTNLDIIAYSVGLQDLCIVHILQLGDGVKGLTRMFNHLGGTPEGNAMRAQGTFECAQRIHII